MSDRFDGPVFVVGVERSGTTLLSMMLDRHSEIAIPYESKFITDYYRDPSIRDSFARLEARRELVARILSEPYVAAWDCKICVQDIDLTRCSDLASTVASIYGAYARRRGKRIWGDKDPYYAVDIDILNELFPGARYVHILRDGRDVAMSTVRQWWGPNDFISAIRHWRETVRLSEKMLRMLPAHRSIEVRYEDLVVRPEPVLQDICSLLEVSFEPPMASDFSRDAERKVGTERLQRHHAELRRPPGRHHVARWKRELPAADQAIAWEIAGTMLEAKGYERGCTRHWAKPLRRLYHRFQEIQKTRKHRRSSQPR